MTTVVGELEALEPLPYMANSEPAASDHWYSATANSHN